MGAANIFDADVLEVDDGSAVCSAMDTRLRAAVDAAARPRSAAIVIRPERIALHSPGEPISPGRNVISGTVAQVVYLGASTQVHVDVGALSALVVEVPNHSGPRSVTHQPGTVVNCVGPYDAVRVLHRSTAVPITDPVTEQVGALSAS